MNDRPGRTLVVKRFPAKLHRALRMASADAGEDMREIVIRAVEAELAGKYTAKALDTVPARLARPAPPGRTL